MVRLSNVYVHWHLNLFLTPINILIQLFINYVNFILIKCTFNFIRNNLSDNDFISKDTRCLDICFDKLRRTNKLNLKTFIINNASFIHYVHKTRNLPYCLYHWEAGALNGKPVPEDFIIL